MLMKAIKWSNGMVVAFDERGEQIPDLQGSWDQVKFKLSRDSNLGTKWMVGDWRHGITDHVSKADFFAEVN